MAFDTFGTLNEYYFTAEFQTICRWLQKATEARDGSVLLARLEHGFFITDGLRCSTTVEYIDLAWDNFCFWCDNEFPKFPPHLIELSRKLPAHDDT